MSTLSRTSSFVSKFVLFSCFQCIVGLAASGTAGALFFNFDSANGLNLGGCGNLSSQTSTCTTRDGFTISTDKGFLHSEEFREVNALGVDSSIPGHFDPLPGEVATDRGEHLGVGVVLPSGFQSHISYIVFSRLFGPLSGEPGGFESVRVGTDVPGLSGVLTLNPGDSTASWVLTIGGTARPPRLAQTLSPSVIPGDGFGAGEYGVGDPFGSSFFVQNLRLDPGPNAPGFTNDFALVALATDAAPEIDVASGGGAIALLLGVLFLTSERRQRLLY